MDKWMDGWTIDRWMERWERLEKFELTGDL
jgi:hypothetical protein